MKQVMIDNETLGTTADAVILSIGAVKFDIGTGEIDDAGFYASISIASNQALGRRIDEDTLLWWLKRDVAAQAVFFEAKETLETALIEFSDWLGHDDLEPWSNGADFDVPMLAHAYRQCGIEVPWKPFNVRCFRTFKNLPGAERVTKPAFMGVKHNAMADAHHQALWATKIHSTLFSTKAKTKA